MSWAPPLQWKSDFIDRIIWISSLYEKSSITFIFLLWILHVHNCTDPRKFRISSQCYLPNSQFLLVPEESWTANLFIFRCFFASVILWRLAEIQMTEIKIGMRRKYLKRLFAQLFGGFRLFLPQISEKSRCWGCKTAGRWFASSKLWQHLLCNRNFWEPHPSIF